MFRSTTTTTNTFVLAVVAAAVAVMSSGGTHQCHQVEAFATPGPSVSSQQRVFASSTKGGVTGGLKMGFFNDEERKPLTRDSEPEEFFATNTDKMSDEEKIPIAIIGLVGISAPFILGLIALYAARY